jgi:hypothetical protein
MEILQRVALLVTRERSMWRSLDEYKRCVFIAYMLHYSQETPLFQPRECDRLLVPCPCQATYKIHGYQSRGGKFKIFIDEPIGKRER